MAWRQLVKSGSIRGGQTAPNGCLDWKAKTTFAGKLVAQQHKCANIGGKKGSTVEEMGGRGVGDGFTANGGNGAVLNSTVCRTLPVLNTTSSAHYQC